MVAELTRRLLMFLRGSRMERELDEEMRLHVELREEQLRNQGLSANDARAATERRFGNMLRLRDESVDAWGWRWLEQLVQDVRFGVRTLLKHPGFTATAVVTLALATGATTAIFSIVHSVLLRPLPFADPERLVQVEAMHPRTGAVHPLDLQRFRTHSTSFEALVGYWPTTRHLDGPAGPERLAAFTAERGLFSLLGVQPIAGRTFRSDDPLEVAVISAALWQRRFNRDPTLPGKTITLDGQAFTILGVMPETFQFPYSAASMMPGALPEARTDLWIPADPPMPGRGGLVSYVAGRLKPESSLEHAAAELTVLALSRDGQNPDTTGVHLSPLAEVVVGPMRRSLWMLFAAVGLVLLAACANVANLLLARTTIRTREVAIRAALGAGRLRLIRLFLTESLLLALGGGLVGLAIAGWGTNLLVVLGAAKIPRAHEITIDWQVFVFLLLACVTTAVLCGWAPALTAARTDVHSVTKETGGQATMGPSPGRIRDSLAVTEVALAFVLALGAAVMMREVIRLQHVEAGMITENVLALHLTPRAPARDYYAIEAHVAQMPGVQSAGFIQLVPLQNWGWEATFSIRGRPPLEPAQQPIAGLRYVTPGYFRTMGIPVVQGRAFTDHDHADAPRVILINEALAHRYFSGEDPVGRDTDRGTIVGVVRDVRNISLDRPPDPEIYYAAAQNVTMASDIGMSLLVRTHGAPARLVDALRSAVRDVNPNLAIFNVKTMDQVRADSLWELNLYRWLIGLFATLALALAAIGLYGVMSYTATARTREFAIRLALGSDPIALARLVLTRGLLLGSVGVVCGALAALALARLLRDLPIGGRPDAAMFAAVSALLLAMAVLSCAVPALRVTSVNPVTALRQD